MYGRRSDCNSGGRMTCAEGWSVLSRVGYGDMGRGVTSRLDGLGERRELPSGVLVRALADNEFWRILKATERYFLYLCNKI